MKSSTNQYRLPFDVIEQQLYDITRRLGFNDKNARLIAHTHTQSSCDGVESHGLNRFPRFVEYVRSGYIRIDGEMERIAQFGALEQFDGQGRAGILNASESMSRAISLAKSHGLGAVALRNTTHWMRAGTYGWMAVENGCMAICMTNTIPNMAPWGGQINTIGNNPIVLAVPRGDQPVVLDMAMSQYSYGGMEDRFRSGEKLPYPGGWDANGQLTDDPATILSEGRVLPAGLWKGSGLSILTDLMVTLLSGGLSSHEIGRKPYETGLSQLFICIDTTHAQWTQTYQSAADSIIQSIHSSATNGQNVYYPGERTLLAREINMRIGVPVNRAIWDEIISFSG